MPDNIPWSFTFDFKMSDGKFSATIYPGGVPGVYVPNTGWRSQCQPLLGGPGYYDVVDITLSFAAAALTSVLVVYDNNFQSIINSDTNAIVVNGTAVFTETPYRVTNGSMYWGGALVNVTSIKAGVLAYNSTIPGCEGSNGNALIKSIILTGIGFNPFLKHRGPKDCPFCDTAVGAEVGGG